MIKHLTQSHIKSSWFTEYNFNHRKNNKSLAKDNCLIERCTDQAEKHNNIKRKCCILKYIALRISAGIIYFKGAKTISHIQSVHNREAEIYIRQF